VSQPSARYQRSTGGLIGALLVLLVLALGYVGVGALTGNDPETPVRTVDYARVEPAARRAADFDLVAPPSLPDGWRATTVRFVDTPPQHWHLGVLTDTGRYVGLEQGRAAVPTMVRRYVDERAQRGRRVQVAGEPWTSYTDSDDDLALVRREGRTTTLVVGNAVPLATLVSYTASLR